MDLRLGCILGERKEHLLEPSLTNTRCASQLIECAMPSHGPAGKKNKSVASPLGVHELMNRQQ